MAETFYIFKSPDGAVETMTLKEAVKRPEAWVKERILVLLSNLKNRKRKDDGFKAGWQDNINEYCGGRQEYNKRLKELGLQEIGYDYVPQSSEVTNYHPLSDPEMVKELAALDPDLSGQELSAIETGEYFKDSDPIT